jgi:hypothetical protein
VIDRRTFIVLTGVPMAPFASLGQQQPKVARIGFLAGDSLIGTRGTARACRFVKQEANPIERTA